MREGNPVLHRDRISESTPPHERGLSEVGPRRSPTPYLFGVSDKIVVLGTATKSARYQLWRYGGLQYVYPDLKWVSTMGESQRGGANLPIICCDLKYT